MHDDDRSVGRIDLALERKVSASKWAIYFERVWPRVWLVLAVLTAFLLVSMAGLWEQLSPTPHLFLLGAFGVALFSALVFTFMVGRTSREQAIARMERMSGIKHRPASSYEDTLSSGEDPATRALWRAHRSRLARLIDKLHVAGPRPHTERFDPFALRAGLLLGLFSLFGLAAGQMHEKITQAFEFQAGNSSGVRVDAWVSPPSYTGQQPVMLTGTGNAQGAKIASDKDGLIEVPANSELIVRSSTSGGGADTVDLALVIHETGKEPRSIDSKDVETPGGKVKGVSEMRYRLRSSARVKLLVDKSEGAKWTFAVTPDAAPKITVTKPPENTRRGSMKLHYKVVDDYGLTSAVAKLKKAPAQPGDPSTAWAREGLKLTGPRLPQERPPELPLRLPPANSDKGEAVSNLELASHPWAGLRVIMTLEAVDVAGQVGRSKPFETVLPQRRFYKPFARAIIEQRRKLVSDSRYRPFVRRALDALTLRPERFIDDVQVYLGLRTASHRLAQNDTREALNSVIEQLWHVAVRIEDGDLSDAERRLREAQERLAKALEEGASDEEIQQAMDELRQALNEYLQQLQKQAQDNPLQQRQNESSQSLSKQELDQMMKDLENQALNGSREKAQQMLSDLRDLLDRIDKNQSSQMSEQQRQQQEQARRQMEQLGDIIGKQQKLMDETYQQQRGRQQGRQRGQQQGQQQGRQPGQRGGQQGRQGQQQGQGQPGQRGRGQMPGEGRPPGQQGQGQGGQQGRGQGAPRQGGQPSPEELRARQRELTQRLDQLQNELRRSGRGSAESLRGARDAMRRADQALADKNYQEAARQQGEALAQMREGAQQMAEEMSQNGSQQAGRGRLGDSPRDPLGRPQRATGPQLGTSVKVPDEIDMQRAREILQELRKRLGDPKRKTEELEYFERLLRRF